MNDFSIFLVALVRWFGGLDFKSISGSIILIQEHPSGSFGRNQKNYADSSDDKYYGPDAKQCGIKFIPANIMECKSSRFRLWFAFRDWALALIE